MSDKPASLLPCCEHSSQEKANILFVTHRRVPVLISAWRDVGRGSSAAAAAHRHSAGHKCKTRAKMIAAQR